MTIYTHHMHTKTRLILTWKKRSVSEKALLERKRRSTASFMRSILGCEGVSSEQRLLARACGNYVVNKPLIERAMRIGSNLNEACNDSGDLPIHLFARHTTSDRDLHYLASLGCNPMALNSSGQTVAHVAFSFRNLISSRWVVACHSESWRIPDANGHCPLDYLTSTFRLLNEEPDSTAFRSWAFEQAPVDIQHEFLSRAWSLAISHTPTYDCAAEDVEPIFEWIERLGAPPSNGPELLNILSTSSERIIHIVKPRLLAALARCEAGQINMLIPESDLVLDHHTKRARL